MFIIPVTGTSSLQNKSHLWYLSLQAASPSPQSCNPSPTIAKFISQKSLKPAVILYFYYCLCIPNSYYLLPGQFQQLPQMVFPHLFPCFSTMIITDLYHGLPPHSRVYATFSLVFEVRSFGLLNKFSLLLPDHWTCYSHIFKALPK